MIDPLAGLVPYPQTLRPLPGTFRLTIGTPVVPQRAASTTAQSEQAATAVRRTLSDLPWPDPDHSPDHTPDRTQKNGQLTVATDPRMLSEAYRLTITEQEISIVAGGAPGAFYAAQTLRQLLPDDASRQAPISQHTWQVPCVDITDEPALAWRGAHLDVARHFFPKREVLTLIDAFAALKLNRLHLHLTDDQGWRIESRKYPALHEIGSHRERTRISVNEEPPLYDETPHGGYYTLADLAEISAYAARRMITVVPEIEVPGHASALLAALPEFGSGDPPLGGYQVIPDWGIFPHLMSPLPATREFLRDIFGELLTAMRAPFVHLGGDECVLDSWRNDPVIDAYRRQRGLAGPADLHASFLREIADLLATDFRARAVVWDEGFTSATASGQSLRGDTIVMAWRGMEIARRAAEAGHDVIAAPVLPTYFDYYQSDDAIEPAGIGGPIRLADVAAFSPVPPGWPAEARGRLLGTQFQVWSEYVRSNRDLEYLIFPRACALADVAWAGEATGPGQQGSPGRPPLLTRLPAHLRRLDAAGLEYRPLDGPNPGQRAGTGVRRHRPGYRVHDMATRLDDLAADESRPG
jgi:hexosaminidase